MALQSNINITVDPLHSNIYITLEGHTIILVKGYPKKPSFLKNCDGSGGRTVCPRRLSFSQFVVLMSMINCEKDNLLGQTVLPPEPSQFFKNEVFLG